MDTNILVSALASGGSIPGQLVTHWRHGRFALLTCDEQLEEFRRVTRYPKVRALISPTVAGRLMNELRSVAEVVETLPEVDASPDPWDNYLLALAQVGKANLLITGDKAGLLALGSFAEARIITAREFLDLL